MNNNIAVSVIVAVYNREDLLERCLDSLVFQTLENIEIILVDDYSTDNSWEVMETWRDRFPDKIRIMKSEQKGVAYAKNTGIHVAEGQYLAFVDSDDYVDYKMLRRLYEFAEQHEYPEMVYSPINRVSGKNVQKIATLASHETADDYLKMHFHFLHGKLMRRDLFERFGDFPLLGVGEDISWVFPTISWISTIAYFNAPGYFYELSENSVSSDAANLQYAEDILTGSNLLIEKTNPLYSEHAIIYAFTRVCNLGVNKPLYKDLFDTYLMDNLELIESIEELEKKAPVLFKAISELKSNDMEIPHTVYFNGFVPEDEEEIEKKCYKMFREMPKKVILDETNCDLEHCPEIVSEAYRKKNMEFVGKYFAVKACYEGGGIYIDRDIEINQTFITITNNPCFLGFEGNESFTDKVFGACPKNVCFERILQTYELPELYEDRFAPLASRIKTVVTGISNTLIRSVHIKQKEYGLFVYPTDMFVYLLPGTDYQHVCHYKEEAFIRDDGSDVRTEVLAAALDRHVRVQVGKQNADGLRKDRDFLKNKCTKLEKEKAALQTKVNQVNPSIEKYKKDQQFLKDKASRLEGRTEVLERDKQFLLKKTEKLEQDRTFLKEKTARLEGKVEVLTEDRSFLQKKNARLEDRVKGLSDDKAFLQKKNAQLEGRVEGLKDDRAFLQNKNAHLEGRLEGLKDDRDFLKKEKARLEESVEGLKNDRSLLQNEKTRLTESVEGLEKDRTFLKEKAANLDSELQEFRSSLIARAGRKLRRMTHKNKSINGG